MKNILSTLANSIQHHSAFVQKLKSDAALEIKNAEIAQRTKEISPGMQPDNTAPLEYFLQQVADFEQRMQFYKQQIEDMEHNLVAMSKQHLLTPKELMGTMKKLHEAFILLAGRVHMIHTSLQNYKEDYLTYRRRTLGETVDIFAGKTSNMSEKLSFIQNQMKRSGPSPFGVTSGPVSRTLYHLNGTGQQNSGSGDIGSSIAGFNTLSGSNIAFGTPTNLRVKYRLVGADAAIFQFYFPVAKSTSRK
nr:EOG090X0D34 [Ilyocryptus agilis]